MISTFCDSLVTFVCSAPSGVVYNKFISINNKKMLKLSTTKENKNPCQLPRQSQQLAKMMMMKMKMQLLVPQVRVFSSFFAVHLQLSDDGFVAF